MGEDEDEDGNLFLSAMEEEGRGEELRGWKSACVSPYPAC